MNIPAHIIIRAQAWLRYGYIDANSTDAAIWSAIGRREYIEAVRNAIRNGTIL